MKHDPFTLRVALAKNSSARGELYLDDGVTFEHKDGALVWREFVAEKSGKGVTLRSHDLASAKPFAADLATYDPRNAYADSIKNVRVEKIIVLGLASKPSKVALADGTELAWEFAEGVASNSKKEGTASVLTIKDPKVRVAVDWELVITPKGRQEL
jgi:alpha 1,3-glucosidase